MVRQEQIVRRNVHKPIYHRLNKNMECLENVINWTVEHIDLTFTWPTQYNEEGQEHISFEEDKVKVSVSVATFDPDVLGEQQLQDIHSGWIKHLKSAIKELQDQSPRDFTPMAEFELWRMRETQYNTLLEQMKHPFVGQITGMLCKESMQIDGLIQFLSSRTDKLASFTRTVVVQDDSGTGSRAEESKLDVQWQECEITLKRNFALANENYKYLSTIQEFLKVIT